MHKLIESTTYRYVGKQNKNKEMYDLINKILFKKESIYG